MTTTSTAADFICQLRLHVLQADAIPEAFRPPDLKTGYEVQAEVVRRLLARHGGRVAGYKVACTNRLAQELLDIRTPFYGCLLSPFVFGSPARQDAAGFSMRLIEPEFAFELAEDLPPRGTAYSNDAVAEAVAAVVPAIELVDTRFTDWTTAGAPSLVSDNGCNSAWVKGAPFPGWQALDLAAHTVSLIVNGETRLTGQGSAVLGHPLNSLTWLANTLIEHGKMLKAGDLVSTGVCTDVYRAEPTDEIVADFGPIGRVAVSFHR